ncbi:hypothetical protein Tco_1158397 [Tanacetum coccineum]
MWSECGDSISVPKSCLACSRVFAADIYGDYDVSCDGIVGIKHRHNIVRDTLVDICFRSGILAGKEVDIVLSEGQDKPLRPADIVSLNFIESIKEARSCVQDLTSGEIVSKLG